MTRGTARQGSKPRLYKRELTNPETLALAARLMPIGDGEPACGAHVWVDGRSRPRRMKVNYPNGWTATISISADGKVTARSATLKLVGWSPPPAEARETDYATIGDSDGDDGA